MVKRHKRQWLIAALILLLITLGGIWMAREPPRQSRAPQVEDVDTGEDPVVKQDEQMMRLDQPRQLVIDTETEKATALRNRKENKYDLRYEFWQEDQRLYRSQAVKPGGAITDYQVALDHGTHEVDVRAVVVDPETNKNMNTMTIPVTLIIQ